MIEGFLIVIGAIFFIWLFALLRQLQRSLSYGQHAPSRPVVPANLSDGDEAVLVAEGHGRIVWANDVARGWFGIDGGVPNLSLMARQIQPPDVLLDLLAEGGHASFRLGKRRIEAVSHPVPVGNTWRMVVVMREVATGGVQSANDFDPLRAMAIASDISSVLGAGLTLGATVEGILRALQPSVDFAYAEITLWQPETQTLRIMGSAGDRPSAAGGPPSYQLGEGYSGWIALYRQPLLVGDVTTRTDAPPTWPADLRSYLGIPLSISGRFLGTLDLMSQVPHAFSQRDLALLTTLSDHIAAVLEAARAYRDQTARVAELSGLQQITAALSDLGDPAELFAHLVQRLAHLMDVELCGVLLYDDDTQTLRAQSPFYGAGNAGLGSYRLTLVPDTPAFAIWQHPSWYTNDPADPLLAALEFERLCPGVMLRNVALVPMVVGARRVGLLLAANRQDGQPFMQEDMRPLMSFATQAAVVVENARLYAEEHRRAHELGALHEIAQAVGSLRAPSDLFAQITARVAALLDARLCGILLYDPQDRLLVSQRPFYGLDDDESLLFYRVPVAPGSAAEQIWLRDEPWISNDVRRDPLLADSDMGHLASLVGIHQTIIVPLVVGGRRLGLLQVANKRHGTRFTDEDARLMAVFAGQAAMLIDSARLYREMQRRTHEAEGLRAITEIASEPSPEPETFEQVLIAIANLLEAQVVGLALIDGATGQLVLAPHTVWGVALDEPHTIDPYAPGFEHSVLMSRQPFISNNLRDDRHLLPPYRALTARYNLYNAVQVPVVLHGHGIGELTVANRTGGESFTPDDMDLLSAIATQIAAMIDRIRLHAATDADLRRRVRELDALSRISHELSETHEVERVLEMIRHEALRSTEASAASIALVAPRDEWPQPGQPLLERRLGDGKALGRDALAPIERLALLRADAVLVTDYTSDALLQAVPDTARAALAAPVLFNGEPVAVIHLYAEAPGAFDPLVVEFATALADQAAIALGNARRYQAQLDANRHLRDRVERMGRISEFSRLFREGASLTTLLEEVARGVRETVGFDLVLISVVDESRRCLRRTAQAGMDPAAFVSMQQVSPPLSQAGELMQERYRVGQSYFIPAEGAEGLPADLPTYRTAGDATGTGPAAWHPEDLLLVPIYGTERRLLGLMSVDQPRSGRRPSPDLVEALELFATQAAFSIENFRLIERIQREAEATRRERDRLAQLHMVASEIQRAPDVASRLQVVADGIHHAGWQRVVITLRDEHLDVTSIIHAGYGPDETEALAERVLPGETWRRWIKDLDFHALKLGAGFYLRYSEPWVRQHVYNGQPPVPGTSPLDRWHPEDTFYLPLVGQDQKRIIGIIEMNNPADGRVPTESALQPFELFASQAAAALETSRLYVETLRAAEQEQRLNEMMEAVSSSLNSDAVIQAIGRGLRQMVPFTRMSMALHDEDSRRFQVYRVTVAPSGEATVTSEAPLGVDDTATGMVFHELEPRVFRLQYETASRAIYTDIDAWYAAGERTSLIVPAVVAGQAVGVLHLGTEAEDVDGFREHLDLIQRLANLSGVALENARLFQQARQRAAELDEQAQRLAFLNRVSAKLAQTLDAAEIYRIVLEELQSALGVQSGGLMLIQDARTSRLVLSTHPADPPAPDLVLPIKGNPVAEAILRTRRPVAAEDVQTDPRFEAVRELQAARNTRAMLIVPVIMGGQVFGTIGLDSATPRAFTDAEIELAMTTANQAAIAIEKARLFNEARQRAAELNAQAQRLAVINRVSTRLAETLDPQEIYRIVLSELAEALQVQHAGLVLIEGETSGRLAMDYPFDQPLPDLTIGLEGNRSIERVRATHQPLVSMDVLNDPLFEQAHEALAQRGTRSMMLVPLVVGEALIGTIGLDSLTPRDFTEAEIELAETIAGQVSLAVEKARLYNETLSLTIFNQSVVESIQQGIVVMDRDLRLRRINQYMLERYGWTNDAVGQRLFDYRPAYNEFLRAPVAIVLGTGEPQVEYEVERVDPAGGRSIRNYYVYPMLEGRTVTGIVLLVEDVTERARLEADLNQRAVQMAALTEVSSQITATLEPDQVIALILDAVGSVIPFDGVTLWLRAADRPELHIVAARGYEDVEAHSIAELVGISVEVAASTLLRTITESRRVVNVGDMAPGDPRYLHAAASGYESWLGAPLVSKGHVVGVLVVEKREAGFYTLLHEQLALTFANQAAVALDNAQLFQETRARAAALNEQAQRLALLNRVSLALAQTLDIENIFEIALREAAIALDVPEGSAMQVNPETLLGSVVVHYPRGDEPPSEVYDLRDNAVFEDMRQTLIPIAIEDLDADPQRAYLLPLIRSEAVKSMLMVPLVVGGNVIGTLRLDAVGEKRWFNEAQIELAQTIATQAAIAVQNAALFEQAAARNRELETLFESAQATAVTLDLNEVIRRVTNQMLSAMRADACTVFLWDDVNNRLEVRDDISARLAGDTPDQPGDLYALADYPLRERALRERELLFVRTTDEDVPPSEMEVLNRHGAAARMLVPLVVNEVAIGLVEVETMDPSRYFAADDARLARTLASQAAISIENARLQTETRRTVEELYVINDMSAALSSATNLDELLRVVADQLPNLTEAEAIYVALLDRERGMLSFPLAMAFDEPLDLPPQPLGGDEFSFIVQRQAPLLLAGDRQDQVRRSLGIESALPATARCFLGVPLYAADELIGVLAVRDDDDVLAFTHNDQRILTTVGSQLGVAIQSARLFQQTVEQAEVLEQRVRERTAELEQERQHISTLYQITTELSTSLDMERLLDRALMMVAESVGATQAAILAVDPANNQLRLRAHYGSEQPAAPDAVPFGVDLARWAIQNERSLIVHNALQDPRWSPVGGATGDPAAAIVTLIEANDEVLGVMLLYSERPGAFNDDHLRLVAAAANQVANAMNNAELYSLIRDQAERLATMLRQEQVEATKSSAILDSVADGVVVADADGRVIVFNSTAERMLGIRADDTMARDLVEFAGAVGIDLRHWQRTVAGWVDAGTGYRPGEFLEQRVALDDGRIFSMRLSPVQMGDQFLGSVAVFRDITRDVEVDRLKSEFVATVSHELRTPMTSIKGYADLLLLGAAGEITEQQQHFLETIKQNADRLSTLVNDLLDISRIDQGRVELRFREVDLRELMQLMLEHAQGRCNDEKRAMDIQVSLPEGEYPPIWGDPDKMTQVLTNLVDNALNYTPDGGRITLAARYDIATARVTLSVSDTGIGIPPEVGERIFERFNRGDETQDRVMNTPGTGLGLSIVREFVTMHRGRIWFESEPAAGTTFYVELPVKQSEAASTAA